MALGTTSPQCLILSGNGEFYRLNLLRKGQHLHFEYRLHFLKVVLELPCLIRILSEQYFTIIFIQKNILAKMEYGGSSVNIMNLNTYTPSSRIFVRVSSK